jgi:dTDP-glucose 4,6-dehydratase
VTGGAGFIGSNFVRWLLAREPAVRVVTLDALTYAGLRENLEGLPAPERHRFVHGDVRDGALVETILREEDVDAVVHFAAETHVDRSIRGPRAFVEANVEGTFALLEAARAVWLDGGARGAVRFHHVSTDEVYGSLGPDDPPFRETTPYDPSSPYSATKAASDHLVRAYHRTYGLPVTITNCSNNYGPRQYPEKLIPVMLLSARSGRPLPLYGDGQQRRDWLYVDDHCEAVWRVVCEGRVGETYNVGGRCEVTNLALVEKLCAVLDRLAPESPHAPHERLIAFVEDRPGHDRRYAMDISKIERELGWTPRETLESGLEKTVTWYLHNRDWLEAVAREKGLDEWWEANYAGRLGAVDRGQ